MLSLVERQKQERQGHGGKQHPVSYVSRGIMLAGTERVRALLLLEVGSMVLLLLLLRIEGKL